MGCMGSVPVWKKDGKCIAHDVEKCPDCTKMEADAAEAKRLKECGPKVEANVTVK